MRDIARTDDRTEKEIVTPKEKIETFGDIKKTDQADKLETFDTLKGQNESGRIETFDDLKKGNKTSEIHDAGESRELSETSEQKKLNVAAVKIKNADWLQSEKWQTLNNDEKRIALDREAGDSLSDALDHPKPPLTTDKSEPNALGHYGDGYSYDKSSEQVVGSDYGIQMNEEGMKARDEKLFGDDPKAAIETYSHEFRHSYQKEQAQRYEKGFKADNPEQAKEWSDNFRDYKTPPDSRLAETDPERYEKEFAQYRDQPVESDAREFASKLLEEIDAVENNDIENR